MRIGRVLRPRFTLPSAIEILGLLSITALATVGCLALWSVLPLILGWSPTVVMTGSMHPQIAAGDVVVCSPVEGKRLQAGFVVRFRDPSDPSRYLLHRITRIQGDSVRTRGDANRSEDTTPVPADAITGMGRLRVPWIGLPALWLHGHEYGRLAALGGAGLVMCVLAPYGWNPLRREPAQPAPALDTAPADDGPSESPMVLVVTRTKPSDDEPGNAS